MDRRLFHKRLFDATEPVILPGSAVVCAVSGGIDSMALLRGLVSVNDIHTRDWTIHVAHLDHGLRPQSADDANFVRDQALAFGLGSTIATEDVSARARSHGETIEEAARHIRYAFLEVTARSIHAAIIAVAHHADDQAETVLHRLARGAGLKGLAGMPAARPILEGSSIQLIRPLLHFSRAEIAAYTEHAGIPFRQDPTNADADYSARNRIRGQVLPLLRHWLNPDIDSALVRLARHARRSDDAIQVMARAALGHLRVERRRQQTILAAHGLAVLPPAVQSEIVFSMLRDLGVDPGEIGFERIEAILALISADGRRRTLQLPGGAVVIRRGRYVCFAAAGSASDEEPGVEITMKDHQY